MKKMSFTITTTLKDKLALMSKIYMSNRKSGIYPMAVMADRKGFFHCCSIADTLSYKLGSDELGMIPELPDEAIIFPDGVVRLILSMPAGTTLDIESEGNCVSVKTRGKKSSCKFNVESKDFPTIEEINPTELNFAMIESSFIRTALENCAFAMSTNNSKPIFTGLNFVCKNGMLEAYAIDGFKIARSRIKSEGEFSFTITKDAVSILMSCLKSANSKINIGINKSGNKAVFIVDNQTVLRTSLLTGTLMEVDNFFVEHEKSVKVDTVLLLGVLKQITTVATKDEVLVVMTISDDNMSLSYNGKTATYVDTVPIETQGITSESPERIGINVGYLTDCVKAVNDDNVSLSIKNALNPIVITGKTETETVLVPMRIAENN